jgi:hypothetical protein
LIGVKAWVYSKLAASTALVTALGSLDRIEYAPAVTYPITSFPRVTYMETNQPTSDYYDDAPETVESSIEIHVWTAEGISTTTISGIVDGIMTGLLFNVDFSADIPEPETRVNHRVLRYGRTLTALDLY